LKRSRNSVIQRRSAPFTESDTCTREARDAREIYPSATICYCTKSEGTPARDKAHAQCAAPLRRWISCKGPTVIGCWRDRSIFHETRRRPISVFTARLFWPPDAVAGFYTNLTGGPLGREAMNCRCTRSSGHWAASAGMVVRFLRPRTTPQSPSLRPYRPASSAHPIPQAGRSPRQLQAHTSLESHPPLQALTSLDKTAR
jgi:hypothetical protein